VTEIIGYMAIVKSGFHTRKHFCENYPQFGYAPSRRFATPKSKKFKEYRF